MIERLSAHAPRQRPDPDEPRPARLSYTAAEMAAVFAERDRLRKFVADIRTADAMVVVTRGAAEVRRVIREFDEE